MENHFFCQEITTLVIVLLNDGYYKSVIQVSCSRLLTLLSVCYVLQVVKLVQITYAGKS